MSQDEKHTTIIIGIVADTTKLIAVWETLRKIFLDYADSVVEALTPVAEAISDPFSINEPLYLSAEKLENFIKQVDENDAALTGTSPKKYGLSIRKHPRKSTMHHNYIPRTPRHLPYQRRAY